MADRAAFEKAPTLLSPAAVLDDDDDDVPTLGGPLFLLRWIEETWGEAAKGVLGQLLFFYTLMLIGFACILLLARSTSKIRELRKNVAEVIRDQRNRKVDIEDMRASGGYMF